MVGRQRWWAAPLGVAALLWSAPVAALDGAELRGMRVESHVLRLELSRPVEAAVVPVRRADGSLARVYLDLPATRLASGVPRQTAGSGSVLAARVGRGDGGQLRVAVEVRDGAGFTLRPEAGGKLLRLRVEPAPAPVAAPARPRPPPVAAPRPAPGPEHGRPAPVAARAPGPPRLKIVIDPGHGGRDPGASGYAVEKSVTLAIARRLAVLLRERVDAEVVLTRTDDRYLALSDRTARANAERADLFVSIHANASRRSAASGVETYLLDNTNDHATLRLAAMENGVPAPAPRRGETDLRYILSDMVQVGKLDESDALAKAIQGGLVRHMRQRYSGVVDLGVKRGPFYVLVGAHMPCVLVETAFLTHPVEGRRLARAEFQAAVAEGIYAGIAGYLADAARARTL